MVGSGERGPRKCSLCNIFFGADKCKHPAGFRKFRLRVDRSNADDGGSGGLHVGERNSEDDGREVEGQDESRCR